MKLSAILFCAMLALFAVPAFAAGPTLSLANQGCVPGRLVTIPVTLTTNGAGIAAVGFDLGYDPAMLTPTGLPPIPPSTTPRKPAEIGPAGIAVSDWLAQSQPTASVYRVGVLTLTGNAAIGDGVVAYVTFAVAADAPNYLTLTITPTATDLNDSDIAITGFNSIITH